MQNARVNLYLPERGNYQSDQQHGDVVDLYQRVYALEAEKRTSKPSIPAKSEPVSGPSNTKLGGLFLEPGLPVSGESPQYNESTGQFEYTTAGGTSVPPTSTSPGRKGQIATDGTYIYIAVGDNHWMRASLSSF